MTFHLSTSPNQSENYSTKEVVPHPHPGVIPLCRLVGDIDNHRENDADCVNHALANLPSLVRLFVEVANQTSGLLDIRPLGLLVFLNCHAKRPTCLAYMNATNVS